MVALAEALWHGDKCWPDVYWEKHVEWRKKMVVLWFITCWWFGTCFIFSYIGNNHPNWLICFRGVETTNQWISCGKIYEMQPLKIQHVDNLGKNCWIYSPPQWLCPLKWWHTQNSDQKRGNMMTNHQIWSCYAISIQTLKGTQRNQDNMDTEPNHQDTGDLGHQWAVQLQRWNRENVEYNPKRYVCWFINLSNSS